uniref:Response regulator n=1 Tax=uncultured sulfate-reducing bacterium TaxID=153939 RepID=Q3IBN4_9BACT|nr:Response regulator [uncultured sulfate-reducing bacterium]
MDDHETRTTRSRSFMTQTILAVDDEPHILKLLEHLIDESTPYVISTTHNSLEVPELLNQTSYDLILTDLRMPGLNGMDILRTVKEQERFEEVIIITAFGSLDNALAALSLGVFDYITKPFKREQIVSSIDRAMRWQAIKRDGHRMKKILNIEPFERAKGAFEREYIRRLSRRYQNDEDTMVTRSGLPIDRIVSPTRDEELDAD